MNKQRLWKIKHIFQGQQLGSRRNGFQTKAFLIPFCAVSTKLDYQEKASLRYTFIYSEY